MTIITKFSPGEKVLYKSKRDGLMKEGVVEKVYTNAYSDGTHIGYFLKSITKPYKENELQKIK